MENEEILENEDILEETAEEETAENTENRFLMFAIGMVATTAACFAAYQLGKDHAIDKIRSKFAAKADSENEGVEEEEK